MDEHLGHCDACGLVVAEAAHALLSGVASVSLSSDGSSVARAPATPLAPVRALPKVGDTLGRYLLMEELGRGAMGVVFAAVFDERVRAATETAFIATAKPFASEILSNIAGALEGHLDAWRAARIDACDATHEGGVQSEELLDLRLVCLDRRLDETRALSERFVAADAAIVEGASEAVARPMVHDARIAALCLEHGVSELLTANREFARFNSLRTRDPLGH